MSDYTDKLLDYVQYNITELQEKFCDKHIEEFDMFCMEEFGGAQQSEADDAYDAWRDEQGVKDETKN